MLKLRPTYEQMLKEAKTKSLRILPERERRSSAGILLDDVDVDEFDLKNYDRRININNNDNPDKATQTNFNSASSSSSSVGEDVRTSEEAVKEELSYKPSIKSNEKPVEKQIVKQKEKSFMRRMFDSMFEEADVDIAKSRRSSEPREHSRQVSVATEERQQSNDSLPMNVKKSCEPSPASSPASFTTNRSVLLLVAGNTLTPQVSPDVIPNSAPSDRSVEIYRVLLLLRIEPLNIYKAQNHRTEPLNTLNLHRQSVLLVLGVLNRQKSIYAHEAPLEEVQ